jgi:hypothetical protein
LQFPRLAREKEEGMRSKALSILAGLAVCIGSSAFALAAEPVVLRVVVVQTDNVEGYVKEIDKGKALMKRLQSSGQVRVWRARFAGENAGAVVVSVEFPNLETMARDEAKVAADGEYAAWLKGLDKHRKIVSDSLYTELK